MAESMNDIMHPGGGRNPEFPDAPEGWTPADAERVAEAENLDLGDDHWQVVKALQRIFRRDADPGVRTIHDAFEEHFHSRGGMRYLYRILPSGPVAQGCRLAGLKAPAGTTDASFGSVQ
ncbi:MAG: TusE/DsrC/DsvC family sulfur relay protein [Proteobacteria bacterium]|nr:MAG: TusE/DsrC/DsvC family sulfur relay protein [Pseudomonadota bacterium]